MNLFAFNLQWHGQHDSYRITYSRDGPWEHVKETIFGTNGDANSRRQVRLWLHVGTMRRERDNTTMGINDAPHGPHRSCCMRGVEDIAAPARRTLRLYVKRLASNPGQGYATTWDDVGKSGWITLDMPGRTTIDDGATMTGTNSEDINRADR